MFFFRKSKNKKEEKKSTPKNFGGKTEIKKDVLINDYISHLEKSDNYKALYLYTSKLSENNQKYLSRQALIETFNTVTSNSESEIFGLPNDDMIIIYNKNQQEEILACLIKVRYILHDEPLIKNELDLEKAGFATYYELGQKLQEAIDSAMKMATEQNFDILRKKTSDKSNEWNIIKPQIKKLRRELTPSLLGKIQKALSMTDFSSLIRRQSVCAIIGKSSPQVLFDEAYVAISDLRDMLLPDLDLTANPWLFLALAGTLDKRVLVHVSQHDDGALTSNFSLNLNVSTILSDEFLAFDESINTATRSTIVLELQLVDMFSDIKAYMLAKTFAQYRGYKICIDGITVDKLKYINRQNLGADLIKIIWHPSFMDIINEDKHFMDYVNRAERAKMILCRVDDPSAVEVGNSLGINMYQGFYIQRLLNSQPDKTIYSLR